MKSILIITAVILVSACNRRSAENKNSISAEPPKPFYKPPIPSANVPFTLYEVDAEFGDTVIHPSGSVLIFPAHSIVNADGNQIKGKVQIQYREFYTPLDIFLSGIPMNYDSAGVAYNLQSAGMCEVLATKNGVPVFVSKDQQPQISLVSPNADPSYNVYDFDSTTQRWNNKGKDELCDFRLKNVQVVEYSDTLLVKPEPPQMAESDMPLINIKIEPGSVPELAAYDNMKFQLDRSVKNFRQEDANEGWDDIRIKKSNQAGVYRLEFMSESRKVSYLVRPVFKGEDYKKAINVFNKTNRAYESAEAKRKAENIKLEKANKIQLAKNEIIEKENKIVIEKNRIAKENYERFEKIYAQQIEIQNSRLNEFVFRTFAINRFGVWNCDKPVILPDAVPISLNLKDEKGNNLENMTTYVVYQNMNTVYPIANNTLRYIPEKKCMIWGVTNGDFYYFGYPDFDKAAITTETKKQDVIFHKYSESPVTHKKMQEILGFKMFNKNLPS